MRRGIPSSRMVLPRRLPTVAPTDLQHVRVTLRARSREEGGNTGSNLPTAVLPVNEMRGRRVSAAIAAPTSAPPCNIVKKEQRLIAGP
jgi:hypothetical protein